MSHFRFATSGQSNGNALAYYLLQKAKQRYEPLGHTVEVINCAVGGTKMEEWLKTAPPREGETVNLYTRMLELINGQPIDMMNFWQGEGSCNTVARALNWYPQSLQLFGDMQADIISVSPPVLPIVMPMLGAQPPGVQYTYWRQLYGVSQLRYDPDFGTPHPRIKSLETITVEVQDWVHKTPAGYGVVANWSLNKWENMVGFQP